MKKGAFISMLLISFLLSSCLTSQENINDAKKELGIIEDTGKEINLDIDNKKTIVIEGGIEDIKNTPIIQDEIIKEKKIQINYLSDSNFLELDVISEDILMTGEIEITGKTLVNVDKIIVSFSNDDSSFPDDKYTLNKFKSGDKNFLYRAFSRYETFDYGINSYIFTAYSGDSISKVELVIDNTKETEVKKNDSQSIILSNTDFANFPVNKVFGSPIELGNSKITYSDIRGLEIKKESNIDLTCENLTDFLSDKIDGWFFWNTCRDIKKDKGISYFIIRLEGDEYIYEKHYYLFESFTYGIQELERGTGVTNKEISIKNKELKEKNIDYDILKISDALFIEIENSINN